MTNDDKEICEILRQHDVELIRWNKKEQSLNGMLVVLLLVVAGYIYPS